MSQARDTRLAYYAEHPQLEFAIPSDIPEAGPIVTWRRGTKWLPRVGARVLVLPAHSQPGPRREMRLVSAERFMAHDLPEDIRTHLYAFYGPSGLEEVFLRLTLEG